MIVYLMNDQPTSNPYFEYCIILVVLVKVGIGGVQLYIHNNLVDIGRHELRHLFGHAT